MRKSPLSPFVKLGAMFALVFALVAGSMTAFGQATPEQSAAVQHPAHIHAGMCPDVGDVVFPLSNVVPVTESANMATAEAVTSPVADAEMGATPAMHEPMLFESTTMVEAPLDDILGAEHAINVHLSPDQLDVYVACGDITGEAENGELVVELQELNDSGVEGEATLTDNGDDTTTVVITLRHVSENMQGTPDATPKP